MMNEQEMLIEEFFIESQNGGTYEIETPQGWVKIGELYRKYNKLSYEIKTISYHLKCSFDHLLLTDKGWKLTENISTGEMLLTKTGWEPVLSKENLGVTDVYDLEVMSDEHSYYSNGIVSHNTAKTTCARSFENVPVEWRGKSFKGYDIVYIPLANYEEMGDLLGLPDRYACMEYRNDGHIKEEWVSEKAIASYQNLGWKFLSEKGIRTLCAPPAWVPSDNRPTILILDDWNRANLRIIKGVMQLLQTYGTATWRLPKGSHIVLTGNPDDQDFQVTTLDKAILTRIRHFTMKFDVKEWSVWAQAQGLDGRGISWTLQHPEMMQGKELTNPRTIAEVFRMTKSIGDLNDSENEKKFRRFALSMLDEDTITSIMLFMQKDVGLVAEPEKIINGESIRGETVTDYVNGLMKTKGGAESRTDIVGILCDRLFAYIHQDTLEVNSSMIKNFQSFITIESIPEDIRYALVNRIIRCKEAGRMSKWVFGNKKLNQYLSEVFQTD